MFRRTPSATRSTPWTARLGSEKNSADSDALRRTTVHVCPGRAPQLAWWQAPGSSTPDLDTPIDNALVPWHSDGTELMNSARPPQDGDFCMGVWKRSGKNT